MNQKRVLYEKKYLNEVNFGVIFPIVCLWVRQTWNRLFFETRILIWLTVMSDSLWHSQFIFMLCFLVVIRMERECVKDFRRNVSVLICSHPHMCSERIVGCCNDDSCLYSTYYQWLCAPHLQYQTQENLLSIITRELDMNWLMQGSVTETYGQTQWLFTSHKENKPKN